MSSSLWMGLLCLCMEQLIECRIIMYVYWAGDCECILSRSLWVGWGCMCIEHIIVSGVIVAVYWAAQIVCVLMCVFWTDRLEWVNMPVYWRVHFICVSMCVQWADRCEWGEYVCVLKSALRVRVEYVCVLNSSLWMWLKMNMPYWAGHCVCLCLYSEQIGSSGCNYSYVFLAVHRESEWP